MSEVDVARGRLPSAWDWIKQAFKLVSQVKDDAALFYGHVDREDICFKLSDRASVETESKFAEQRAQEAATSADAALAIANQHGWKLLAEQCQKLAKTARQRLELVRMQRNFKNVIDKVQEVRAFNPQEPRDVVVTRKFASDESVVPPWFVEMMRQATSQVPNEATRTFLVAEAAAAAGKTAEAQAGFLKSVELLESEYRSLADYGGRKAPVAPFISFQYYYRPMLFLLDRGDTAKAFSLMEASRSRLLMDVVVTGQHIELADPEKQRLYAALRQLRAEISDLRDRLERSLRLNDAKSATDRLLAEIDRLEGQHRELLERIRRQAPELLEIVTAGTVSLDEIQNWTNQDKFDLLEYVVDSNQIVAWHIGASGVHTRSIFLPRTQLLDKIGTLNQTLADSSVRFDTALARQLFLFLIEPLKEFISTDRLVVIPHEELSYVSFQGAAGSSGRALSGDRYQISYCADARLLKRMGQVTSLNGASVLAVAAPGVLKSEAEVRAVARLLPKGSRVVLPDSATKTLVKRLCAGYDVLHLSAHGQFDVHEPMLSFVQLAPQPGDDGKLTAGEMAALPLASTRLVTLSACETGALLGNNVGRNAGYTPGADRRGCEGRPTDPVEG